MIKKISYHIASLMLLGTLIVPSVAMAASQTSPANTGSSDSTQNLKTSKERIDGYKKSQKVALNLIEKNKLKLRCKPAQKKVAQLNKRATTTNNLRRQSYTVILNKLTKLEAKVEAAKVDSKDLQTSIKQMQTLVDTYNQKYTDYQTTLTDLSELGCLSDPEAFQAALLVARASRKDLVASAKVIRTYVNDLLKPVLENLKKELSKKATTAKPATTDGGQN